MESNFKLTVPAGRLADAAANLRKLMADKLKNGDPIQVGGDGDVTGKDGGTKLTVQPGKLADAAANLRKLMADKLKNGDPIQVGGDGDVTGKNGGTKLTVQPGKLAVTQWYESYPDLLENEKAAMNHFFPRFTLNKNNDGRLFWHGTLRPGILPNGWAWEVAAVYNNDHPTPTMGSSVKVFLLNPTIEEVENAVGGSGLHHVIRDSDGLHLCTTRAEDMSGMDNNYTTSAAQTLSWTVKWLTCFPQWGDPNQAIRSD